MVSTQGIVQIVFGVVLLLGSALVWIIADLVLQLPTDLCSPFIFAAGVYRYFLALLFGVGFLGLTYIIGGALPNTETQVEERYRPLRWIGHAIFYIFLFQVFLHVSQVAGGAFVYWVLPTVFGLGLAYAQASHDSMTSSQVSASATGEGWFAKNLPAIEAWVVGLLIVLVTILVYGISVAPAITATGTATIAARQTFGWFTLLYYAGFHLLVLGMTNGKWFSNNMWREYAYMFLEFVYILIIYILLLSNFYNVSACTVA